ncbi:MAG: DUF4268 domain-containing protein [Bacteroidota bacterium]
MRLRQETKNACHRAEAGQTTPGLVVSVTRKNAAKDIRDPTNFAIMYTRQEISRQREAFWTTFGQYMRPVLSADGLKVNWVNYKTGIAGIHFKMEAHHAYAGIAIVLSHADTALRNEQYQQFARLRELLHEALGEEWQWLEGTEDEFGKPVSIIKKELPQVNINNNEDWPKLISFFKQRIIALDEFWSAAKYTFEQL